MASASVGKARDSHLAEDGGEHPLMAGLDGMVRDPLVVDDFVEAFLARRAQVQVVLQQLAEQLASC